MYVDSEPKKLITRKNSPRVTKFFRFLLNRLIFLAENGEKATRPTTNHQFDFERPVRLQKFFSEKNFLMYFFAVKTIGSTYDSMQPPTVNQKQ